MSDSGQDRNNDVECSRFASVYWYKTGSNKLTLSYMYKKTQGSEENAKITEDADHDTTLLKKYFGKKW